MRAFEKRIRVLGPMRMGVLGMIFFRWLHFQPVVHGACHIKRLFVVRFHDSEMNMEHQI